MEAGDDIVGGGGVVEVEMEDLANPRNVEFKEAENSREKPEIGRTQSRRLKIGGGDVSAPDVGKGSTEIPTFQKNPHVVAPSAVQAIEDNEELSIDPDRARAKLEVLHSKSIKWMLIWYYGAIVLTFIILIAWSVCVAVKFREEAENLENFPLLQFDLLGSAAVSLVFFIMVIAFLFRIILLPWKKKNVEMIWTCVMLAGLVVIFNPVYYGSAAWTILDNDEDFQATESGLYVLVAAILYEFCTFFYMLCMIKLYGMYTNPKGVKAYVIFYLKVIIPVSIPLIVKMVTGLVLNFRYYYTPFGALITLLMLAIEGYWDTKLYVSVIVSCTLEILLFAYIAHSARITWKKLARIPYAPYRYKQLGFRFFLYHTMTCWIVLCLYDILVTASTPVDRYVNSFIAWEDEREAERENLEFDDATLILGQSYAFFPVILLICVWAIEIAYVNLPANSKGIRGWFLPDRCQKSTEGDVVQLARVYVATEEQSQEVHGTRHPDLFCVETCVEALNMAKLVYNDCKSGADFSDSVGCDNMPDLPIVDYIYIENTDTHCIIGAGKDRIYVCFRGTKSMKNIKTDLKSSTSPADNYFVETPSLYCAKHVPKREKKKKKGDADDDDSNSLEEIEVSYEEEEEEVEEVEKQAFTRTKSMRASVREAGKDAAFAVGLASVPEVNGVRIHSGFLKAYLGSRRKVFETLRKHLKKDHETIFVVGHSLGGALATLFSYDLAHRKGAPGMSDKKIISYTFGSPRVGNRTFHNHFNQLVPVVWRVVNAQDIVTQIPLSKMGFKHIGVMVLLDRNGNLMVDPSFIEKSWSHRTVASSGAFHLGGVYIQNLSLCIENLNKLDFSPKFWERKVEEEEVLDEEFEEEGKTAKVKGFINRFRSGSQSVFNASGEGKEGKEGKEDPNYGDGEEEGEEGLDMD